MLTKLLDSCHKYSLVMNERAREHPFPSESLIMSLGSGFAIAAALSMRSLMEGLKADDDIIDQELEDSHGNYEKMKAVLEKRIQLYTRYLKKEGLTEIDRLRLENKKEWTMSHLLLLIMKEEAVDKFSELTKRIYRSEKKIAGLPGY